MPKRVDRTGQRFGRLVVFKLSHRNARYQAFWRCQCDCGNEKVASGSELLAGDTQSCGCLSSETTAARNHRHGYYGTPEYKAWSGMIQRCTNPRNSSFVYYGGRGIKVFPAWLDDFTAFLRDVGERPSPLHSIDRYPDNDGDYEPGNVRWATDSEQIGNRRFLGRRNAIVLSAGGQGLSVPELAAKIGVSPSAIYKRIRLGWTPEQLLQGRFVRRPAHRP